MKLFILMLTLLCLETYAHDNLAPHSHDKLELDVVVANDENKLILALEGAAMPLLGFEGKANTQEKKDKISKVKELWASPKEWLSIAKSKGCEVASSSFSNEVEEYDDHGHAHSEIEAELVIKCDDISKIKSTTFSFLKALEDKKIVASKAHIELSVIPAKASAYKKEITKKSFDIKL